MQRCTLFHACIRTYAHAYNDTYMHAHTYLHTQHSNMHTHTYTRIMTHKYYPYGLHCRTRLLAQAEKMAVLMNNIPDVSILFVLSKNSYVAIMPHHYKSMVVNKGLGLKHLELTGNKLHRQFPTTNLSIIVSFVLLCHIFISRPYLCHDNGVVRPKTALYG